MKKVFFYLLLTIVLSDECISQVNLTKGLVAHYPFDGNAKDASGNNNDPIFNNARLTKDRLGNTNSAFHFNGVNQYMRMRASSSLDLDNKISLCAWVRPTGFYTGFCHNNMILSRGYYDYEPGNYSLRFADPESDCNDFPKLTRQRFYGPSQPLATSPFIKLNNWYYVVYTYDGVTAKIYVNCMLIASQSASINTFTSSHDLFIGKNNSDRFPYWLNGDLDDIRIYDRAINQDEVSAIGGCVPNSATVNDSKIPMPSSTASLQTSPIIEIENQKLVQKIAERKTDFVKSITVQSDSIQLEFYDNASIDGDSITLQFNGNVIIRHLRLTEKPAKFMIKIDKSKEVNTLVMFAENLGSIPPNTALMVVKDGATITVTLPPTPSF